MHSRRDLSVLLQKAKSLAIDAGKILLEEKSNGLKVIRKEKKELVSHLDIVVQDFLIQGLNEEFKDVTVLSEEQKSKNTHTEAFWSIDPIDGTHNFIAGLKSYGISLAYIENNVILVGVIYLPETNDLYYATSGEGAFCNQDRIFCSDVSSLEKSIVAYDNQFYLKDNSINLFNSLIDSTFTMRISGCSVLDACFVSHGLLSARIYNSTKLCDVAAGLLIVKESGGCVSNFRGEEIDLSNPSDVIISGKYIHAELISLCMDIM